MDDDTLHFVFKYDQLEGGNSLFAHVHFGQRYVNGGVSYFICGGSTKPTPCPNVTGVIEGDITAADVVGPNAQGIEPGSFAEILRGMRAGDAYANIHTTRWPGGEIRGQINGRDQREGLEGWGVGTRSSKASGHGRGPAVTREGRPAGPRLARVLEALAITSSRNARSRARRPPRGGRTHESQPTLRTTISPSRTTGRSAIRCRPRMPTSGWLTSGVASRPPSLPPLETVNVEPRSSSGLSVPSRADSASPVSLRLDLLDAPLVHGPEHGHDEALVGLDGDSEVVPLEVHDLLAVQARVQLGTARRPWTVASTR